MLTPPSGSDHSTDPHRCALDGDGRMVTMALPAPMSGQLTPYLPPE